jgi:tRNA A-37 threonylcarbamoyl transferase component Bud32
MDDDGRVSGMLLSYVDHRGLTMFSCIDPNKPPASVRSQWVSQLDAAITELHKAGVVWGDVKAENVLVDRDDNAWITDFGGGYTEGWVDKQVAGTVEGDLAGMAKLREFIFQGEA